MTGCQSARSVGKEETNTRSRAAKAPTLATAAMNPVTGEGDALVDVGRPHVEGHRGHLEAEADQQEGQPGEQHPVVGHHVAGQEVGDLGEVGRSGGAVDQGDAVDEHRRREGAEDEVLEAGLA